MENLNPSSPDLNFAAPADFSRPKRDRGSVRMATRSQPQLTRREDPAPIKGTASLGWLHSTRNLDFCLLALCSCLMAVLCHQVVVIPGSGTGSIAATSSMSRSAQLDFLLKAGLFTGRSQPEVEAEENS